MYLLPGMKPPAIMAPFIGGTIKVGHIVDRWPEKTQAGDVHQGRDPHRIGGPQELIRISKAKRTRHCLALLHIDKSKRVRFERSRPQDWQGELIQNLCVQM